MSPEQIREARAGLGMTQAEFAAALGSDIRTVQRWEAGERSPRGAAARMIETLAAKAKRRKQR